MTEEERQRQMDFIVNQQAHFASGIQQLQETQVRGEARLDRLERVARLMVRAGLRVRRQVRDQDERIAALVDSQIRTEELARQNTVAISQLADVLKQIAARQNGNGRNGES